MRRNTERMEAEMNNALVKSKPLENILLLAEKKRNEILLAERERAEGKNRQNQRIAIQGWADYHLYVDHPLTDDEHKALFPLVRKWHVKRLAKGITRVALSHGISLGLLLSSFLIFGETLYWGPISLVIGGLGMICCFVVDLIALLDDDYGLIRQWYHSYIVRPIRFLKHGHCEKIEKPRIPSSSIF